MVRRFNCFGFGWARARGFGTACVAAGLLAGCASSVPTVGPWGYDFALGNVQDARSDEERKLMAVVPFNAQIFMGSWKKQVGRSIFGSGQGVLDIKLNDYEATQSGWAYALSMEVELTGRDAQDHRIVAQNKATCSAVAGGAQDVGGELVQQVLQKGEPQGLTADGRAATMWQKVLDLCVKDLATQFGEALVAAR